MEILIYIWKSLSIYGNHIYIWKVLSIYGKPYLYMEILSIYGNPIYIRKALSIYGKPDLYIESLIHIWQVTSLKHIPVHTKCGMGGLQSPNLEVSIS